ncbi:glycosyltransferase involved in cell wall biosynthesis [Lutibacter oceani]|uniref:Glycosyltransferase involved in cell wall biosynthesis n=1 Tax=Lutibacter oceani TaxID=1853311 RepID=A0A3D9RWL1_9FLAO|nr:glycosyltransferase family 4 protein [Lutibacter oceani]REE81974.1 glycosyltransferase involved in cell wall biosynthesis [Lutibacter oceani]
MKKILYIGNNLDAKNPTTIVLLSTLLQEIGFEVNIYSNKKNKLLRLLAMCLGVFKYRKASFLLIDTYSTSNFYYALVVSQLARLFNLKYLPILHGGNLPIRLKNSLYLSELIFKNAELSVAPSNYLLQHFKSNGFKTVFIPNGIELKNYPFKLRKTISPKLLWVRAFDEIYNPQMAIKVVALLKETYPNASLCMVGPDKDGSLTNAKMLAKELGVQNSIEFTGLLDKKKWIKKSEEFDVFINTTNIDNTPVSVIEAMALGLPVISTNVGGISYLIDAKIDGILVEKNNETEMANAIINLIENPIKAVNIANNARQKVANFDSVVVKEEWRKLLENA